MRYLSIIFTLSICATAYIGDYVVFNSKYSTNQVFRAFADTSVHGAIGFLSAILFFSYHMNVTTEAFIYNVLFCSVVSSLIDLDHFIVAKSFHLKDITDKRGIFHNTTFCTVITTALLLYSCLSQKANIHLLGYMLLISFTSHHLRDGNRRGIWLYPYSHTPALDKYLYVALTCILPTIYAYVFHHTKPGFNHTVIQYGYV